ncbi:MSMEG_4193 family putative phosphomutase [Segetibacter sp. 3557_3]|uniref:MSMEG_4193 family putative phosphomutase n=1 Tax=Segetibacter sp. 3557_3 TaxID=2547429 RepID=UPI0010586095|nr:MSMEG_4193 family putative phosphomutase [Segetibacter sp. 3557_3]TDH25256.1 MSMEG_4193 family putative phosphomutase [Segetibacter sp. 3557_3]
MTKFVLIRHATTDMVGKVLAGRMEGVSLNEKGYAEAEELANRLAGLAIDAIYSSPLQRTMETAQAISRRVGVQTGVDEHFLEVDFGEWTGRKIEDLRDEPVFKHFNSFRSCTRIPGGELMTEAQARMIAGLEQLRAKHRGETVAIISHSDLIKATLAYYAGIHLDMFQRLEISPASVSIVEVYDETVRILVINHTGSIAG